MRPVIVFLLNIYHQAISPYVLSTCYYTPTCSQYSRDAIEKYGLFKGSRLSLKRLARCRPLGGRGYDPIP